MKKRTRYLLLAIAVIITLGFAAPAVVNTFIGSANTTVEARGGFKVDSGGIELPIWDTSKKFTNKGMSITNGVLAFNSADNNPVYLKAGVWTPFASSGGSGTVTSVSSGNLSPLFTSSVATATTTPAITYTISAAAAYTVLCNTTNASAAPVYSKIDLANMVYGITATANGGTGTATTTSVNTTPIVFGTNNSISVQIASQVLGLAAGIATWLTTPSSANLITALTDEIGSGKAVFFPDDTTISAAYTLTSRDMFRAIHCTNGSNINLTVPSGLGVTFKCEVIQEGAGSVTPTASSTTLTMIPTGTTKTKQAGSIMVIRSWQTANTYTVQGDLN